MLSIFGHFGRFRRAVELSFLAILAVFGGWKIYHFRPFCSFSEGGMLSIFSHLGCFRRAVCILLPAILANIGGR